MPDLERVPTPECRPASCGCGASFVQTKFVQQWLPDRCQVCRDRADAERKALLDATRIQERDVLVAERLAKLDAPPLYANATLASYQLHGNVEDRTRQSRVLQIARRYLGLWPEVDPLIVFSGAPGTGKGHIAWAIARELAVNGVSVRVVKLPALIRDLREAWRDRQGPSEEQRLRRYREPELLVLDEVSQHALYGQPRQHLYDVIDERLEWLRPTIITTNESDDGLSALLGGALLSRVQGGGGLLDFGTADWRSRTPDQAAA